MVAGCAYIIYNIYISRVSPNCSHSDYRHDMYALGFVVHRLAITLQHHLPVEQMLLEVLKLFTCGVILKGPEAADAHFGRSLVVVEVRSSVNIKAVSCFPLNRVRRVVG